MCCLIVYVIIIIETDFIGITAVKESLQAKMQIKDLGRYQYFLGIEVSRN